MAFQTQVNLRPGIGQAGHPASTNVASSAIGGYNAFRAGAAGLTVGTFGYRDGTNDSLINNKQAATGQLPIGFIRAAPTSVLSYGEASTQVFRAGFVVQPVVSGDFFAKSKTTATVGQKVFASTTDGTISTGAAGATVAGHVETDWYVAHGAEAGDLIVISTWSKA